MVDNIDSMKISCDACRPDAEKVRDDEFVQLLQQIPEWTVVDIDGVKQLQRRFYVGDFKVALAMTNKIGELAEAAGHHPAILTEWGKVTVSWWTHKIQGLHKKDFELAAKTDKLVP